jgi:hypothetical protein
MNKVSGNLQVTVIGCNAMSCSVEHKNQNVLATTHVFG